MNVTALQEARRNAEEAQREAEERAMQGTQEQSEDEDEEGDMDEKTSARASSPPDTPEVPDEKGDLDESDDDYSSDDEYLFSVNDEDTEDGRDPRARVLSVLELEDLFMRAAPNLSGERLTIYKPQKGRLMSPRIH